MDSPSILEIYSVVVHPIASVLILAFGLCGWAMALQLNNENIDLKRRLGRLPEIKEKNYKEVVIRYYYIAVLYYSYAVLWSRLFFRTKLKRYTYAKI